MSEHSLDEFDRKAKKFLENGNKQRLRNILREFALCEGYDNGMELDNPERIINLAGVNVEDIEDFTEYQVAKNMVKDRIKNEKRKEKKGVFQFLRS
ncbi:MAG: hypothetical protein BRC29_02130 [Nanohaloarchaea archaeon SW_7_43_1]|nr:MAG: hypothetical protein BRC29_02130 [Nanohaloarchaea archaeon SW_7_43_1]